MAEDILHFCAVRFRVNGSGLLRTELIGLDNVTSTTLSPLIMSDTPGREPTVLANFTGQRVRWKISTNTINEVFKINRIILFAKPLFTSFPQ